MSHTNQLENNEGNAIPPNVGANAVKVCAHITIGGNHSPRVCDIVTKISLAISDFAKSDIKLTSVSRFFTTPCFPVGAGPDFVNAAVSVNWTGTADSLLQALHKIEAQHGRARTRRWGQRTLDLDLIAVGSTLVPDLAEFVQWRDLCPEQQRIKAPVRLILPHPRLQDRAFVLVPLCDIAAEWCHPVSGLSVRQMCDALPPDDIGAIRPL
ncbi:MAG: 2-amino-4-hydroxy-6-hydroxymethyldihydropteridine diphosphokinase [Rhodobacterales bacterium]|jgi:2-amino-4-hydroxy-6-hydroxymethyldihydropteridine diphosphokinase